MTGDRGSGCSPGQRGAWPKTRAGLVSVTLLISLVLAACGGSSQSDSGSPESTGTADSTAVHERHLIDERAGTYSGAGLGDTRGQVEDALGTMRTGPASARIAGVPAEIHPADKTS